MFMIKILSRELYLPDEFKTRYRHMVTEEINFNLQLSYKGREYTFKDASGNTELNQWAESLRGTKLFQKRLRSNRPQDYRH